MINICAYEEIEPWHSNTFELRPVGQKGLAKAFTERRTGYGWGANRIFASSLLILFSSNSLALAFLKSAMKDTKPRMLPLFELPLPKNPVADEDAMMKSVPLPSYGSVAC